MATQTSRRDVIKTSGRRDGGCNEVEDVRFMIVLILCSTGKRKTM